jgi:putative transposase
VQSAQNECLDHFSAFDERHLEYLLREYEEYYNTVRPYQGIGNRTIGIVAMSSPDSVLLEMNKIEYDFRLGGLLRHYYRRAA